jgi:hypothetical protein
MTVTRVTFPRSSLNPGALWSAGRDFLDVTAQTLVYSYFTLHSPFNPPLFNSLYHTAVLSIDYCSTLAIVIFSPLHDCCTIALRLETKNRTSTVASTPFNQHLPNL